MQLEVPPHLTGRAQVVTFTASEDARFRIGDDTYAGGGQLEIALPSGGVDLTPEAGSVVWDRPAWAVTEVPRWSQRDAVSLPATFAIPDPGTPASLELTTDTAGPVLFAFDDGRTVRRELAAPGSVKVASGPLASEVTVHGEGWATLAMVRARHAGEVSLASDPPALEELQAWSAEIAQGNVDLRLRRAVLLADLGQRTAASWDLEQYVARGGARSRAERVRAAIGPGQRTAATAGPVNRAAVEAMVGPSPAGVRQALDAREQLESGAAPEALALALAAGAPGEDVVRAITSRLQITDTLVPQGGAGVEKVAWHRPVHRSLGSQVRAALLAAPWPDHTVLRAGDANLLRAPADAEVDLLCRVQFGPVEPCMVTLVRHGSPPEQRAVPVDEIRTFSMAAGAQVEVRGPREGQALLVHAHMGETTLDPGGTRRAVRIRPTQPAHLVVSGDSVLLVDVVEGSVVLEAGKQRVAVEAPSRGVLPLVGRSRVSIRGRGLVVAYRAQYVAPADREASGAAPQTRGALDVVARTHLPVPSADGALPGRAGSWRIRMTASRDRVYSPTTSWDAVELEAAWARRDDRGWWWLTGWGRAGGFAGGVALERGFTWPQGFVAGELRGGAATGKAGGAWGLDAIVLARHDVRVSPATELRVQGRARATTASAPTGAPVDPRAWTAYRSAHPASASLEASFIVEATRHLRIRSGIGTLSDVRTPLRRVSGILDVDWLVGHRTLLSADARLHARLADDADFSAGVDARGRITQTVSFTPTYRLQLFAGVGFEQVWVGEAGVELWLHHGRGLRDFPADHEPFRTMRGR